MKKLQQRRISIHCASKDRHSEVALLIESLRKQTVQEWDLLLYDDASGMPISNCYFLQNLFNRLRLEGHYVKLIRGDISLGVCNARQKLIDFDDTENPITFRCDDDVILEKDYIEKLLQVIDKGYDMASGVVPLVGYPEHKRENRFVHPIINEIRVDKDGNIIHYADDCGYCYLEEEILPANHFRTNLLYKSEINKKVQYEKGLSPVGFREESFFGLRALWEGYKLGVNTNAKAFHLQTPSGGCRYLNYSDLVRQDDDLFKFWFKRMYLKRGDPFGKKQ